MESGQSSPSKVKVEYSDPSGLFPKIVADLKSRLPLRNLNWNSQTRPLRSIESLFVDLVPDGKAAQSLGRPPSQDAPSTPKSLDQAQPQKERRHQIPGLRSTPYLKIYLLRCDDSETYKATSRKLLREWIRSHGSSTQAKGPNSQENHDAFEWLIVHIAPVEGPSWPTKPSVSVLEKIKSDFNGSSKSSVDRVAQIPCAFDIPGGNTAEAVTPGLSREQFLKDASRGWDDFITKFKSLILASFDSRVRQYEEDIKEKGSQRNIPGWNFCTFFVLKEGLARGFESVGLLDDALMGYDELAIELLSAIEAEQQKISSGEGASLFRENTQELLLQAKEALEASKKPQISNFDAMILDADRKPYRELILANNISVFEFRSYVFARQISVLMRIAFSSGQTSKDKPTIDQAALAEICNRATSFIASTSRTVRQDVKTSLNINSSSSNSVRIARHNVVENMVASWCYCTAQQILIRTEDDALSKELEELNGVPQRMGHAQSKPSNPARLSSLANRGQQPASLVQGQSDGFGEEVLAARQVPPSGQKKASLYRLATQRAELYLVCRRAIDGIGGRQGWYVGWRGVASSVEVRDMDELSLDEEDGNNSSNIIREATLESASPDASIKASILGESLREAMETSESFYETYEELSWSAHSLYQFSGDEKSVHAMISDIATLHFSLKNYAVAASYFHQLAPFYADQNWSELELAILDMYARCLKGLDKPEEYVRIGLKLLAKITSSRHHYLSTPKAAPSIASPVYSALEDRSGQISSIITASKQLQEPCMVHLRNYFMNVRVCQHIEHVEGADGFSLQVTLYHVIPEAFDAHFKVKLVSVSEGQNRDIWLSSNAPVNIKPGAVHTSVKSHVLIPDKYLVDKLVIQAEKVTFQHDFAPKESDNRPPSQSSVLLRDINVPTHPIVVWAPETSFRVTAIASPEIYLDQPRAVLFTLITGDDPVKIARLQIKPATAGLRMYTSDAVVVDDSQDVCDKSEAGLISLENIAPRTSVKIAVPFQLDMDFKQISLRSEVLYNTPQGEFVTGSSHLIPIVLSLGVNVQDIFKSTELYSRFTVSCSTAVPLSVISYDMKSSGDFEAVTYGDKYGRCSVFTKQPMSMVYRIVCKSKKSSIELQTRMLMTIDYQCLDEEIIAAVKDCLGKSLEQNDLVKFRPLLTSHLLETLQEKLPHQDLELVGLLREIGLAPYEEFRWDKVLNAIPDSKRLEVSRWLIEWHKANETIDLPIKGLSAQTRRVTIPVDVPPMHILHVARLRLSSEMRSIAVGETVPAELTIYHKRSWAQAEINNGDPITFYYEMDASPDTWLIGGRRRATFTAKENEELKFPVLLLPQRSGKLLLPTLEVILVEEQGEARMKSSELEHDEDGQWSCDVDYLSQGECILVVPSLKSTTVAMDLEAAQSWVVDSDASSRQLTTV